MKDWDSYLTDFDHNLLWEMGLLPHLPGDHNPITKALAEGDFVEKYQGVPRFSRIKVSRLATLCQMAVFDQQNGPEQDGKPKALRRHWYSWYKTSFAQPFAIQLGDFRINAQGVEEIKDLAWTGRLSTTYASLVDKEDLTYKDLWVEDASRMMEHYYESLFIGCHIIVAVEKDSLFADFTAAAKALGAKSVYSGKGKSSKAAIEKLLREHFSWREDYDPFTWQNPLIVLHISDHDFDGEAVIGPTFAEQARRYTATIREARVGIKPRSVRDEGYEWEDNWYQVKISNSGYQTWAEAKALFLAECVGCSSLWAVKGIGPHSCPHCGNYSVQLSVGVDTPHGFEVEALPTRAYRKLLVRTLLEVMDFEYLVTRLRKECQADPWRAAQNVADDIYEQNKSYQSLLAEFERLEEIKSAYEQDVTEHLIGVADPHKGDFEYLEDDPDPQQFEEYVNRASSFSTPWRPFNPHLRTVRLQEWLEEEAEESIQGFADHIIEW